MDSATLNTLLTAFAASVFTVVVQVLTHYFTSRLEHAKWDRQQRAERERRDEERRDAEVQKMRTAAARCVAYLSSLHSAVTSQIRPNNRIITAPQTSVLADPKIRKHKEGADRWLSELLVRQQLVPPSLDQAAKVYFNSSGNLGAIERLRQVILGLSDKDYDPKPAQPAAYRAGTLT